MFGRRWLHLSLSKPPRRVFIDSPDRTVNLGLKHPPRPHVSSGWLDWRLRLWIYTEKYLQASGMKAVQVDDVGPIRDVCSLSADWTGVSAAAASFISTFSHSLFSYVCWTHVTRVSASAPPQCPAQAGLLMHVFTVSFSLPRSGH